MKRLDMIANWIFEHGTYRVQPVDGWPGKYRLFFYPGDGFHPFYGKTSIEVNSAKPRPATVEKLVKAEIKSRLRDRGWYRNGLRRLIGCIQKKNITMMDDFSKQEVIISGYGFFGTGEASVGVFNNYTGCLANLTGHWEEYCGYK